MSINPYTVGFQPPDEQWKKMTRAWEACEAAGVSIPAEVLAYFDMNAAFNRAFESVSDIICLPKYRAKVLWEAAIACNEIPGKVAEVGSYRGGSAKLIAAAMPDKVLCLFDTFEGVPKQELSEAERALDFSETSEEKVKKLLGDHQVFTYKGVFPETAKGLEQTTFCLLHIDCDIYKTAKACMEYFYPRMEVGGKIVVDDFRHELHPRVDRAVLEYFQWQAVITKAQI